MYRSLPLKKICPVSLIFTQASWAVLYNIVFFTPPWFLSSPFFYNFSCKCYENQRDTFKSLSCLTSQQPLTDHFPPRNPSLAFLTPHLPDFPPYFPNHSFFLLLGSLLLPHHYILEFSGHCHRVHSLILLTNFLQMRLSFPVALVTVSWWLKLEFPWYPPFRVLDLCMEQYTSTWIFYSYLKSNMSKISQYNLPLLSLHLFHIIYTTIQ